MDERKTLKSLDDRDLSTLTILKLIEAMAWKERNKERKAETLMSLDDRDSSTLTTWK